MIYISTGGFKSNTCAQSINSLIADGIFSIELSGGQFEINQNNYLYSIKKDKKLILQVHNYFPPPKDPFVLNLGSLDDTIASKSFDHALNSINLAALLGGKYYSFHAGFLIDPKLNELGGQIRKKSIYDRNRSIDLFVKRVKKLALFASKKNITLLIENNVLSLKNFNEFGQNILLMVDHKESAEIMRKINLENVKMLIDVAHLKVSSNSLNFNPKVFLDYLDEWIAAYHLSENDGTSDDNEKFREDSWFWPFLKKDLDYYSIEVYNTTINELKDQKKLAEKMIYS